MRKAVTSEHLLYILILFVSLGLRFAALGRVPLNDREATLALQSLAISQGAMTNLSGEPGYLTLTSFLFFIFGTSEFWARFWPALMGSVVVVIPYLYRGMIGKRISLALAFFLAIDPVLIAASRTSGGGMIAMAGILAGMGFWLANKKALSGICFGLAVMGGVDLWPGTLVIGLAFITSIWIINPRKKDQQVNITTEPQIRRAIVAGVLTFLAIGSILLMFPKGISTLGSSLVEYFQSWGSGYDFPFYQAGLLWLFTQLPGIVLGVWGVLNPESLNQPLRRFLLYWWIGALLIILLNPARNLQELFWISIPMWVFAAAQLVYFIDHTQIESKAVMLAEAAATIALIIFSILNLIYLINSAGLDQIAIRNRLIGAVLPLILLIVFTVLMAWGWSENSARKGLLVGLGVILIVGYIGSSWKAASLGSNPGSEILGGQAFPAGRQYFLTSISDLSKWKTGQPDAIDIQLVGINSPSLDWALRDFKALTHETLLNVNTTPSVVISEVDVDLQSSAIYRGQKLVWAVKPDPQLLSIKEWVKWGFLRKAPLQKTEYLLWARNDLFAGSDNSNQE